MRRRFQPSSCMMEQRKSLSPSFISCHETKDTLRIDRWKKANFMFWDFTAFTYVVKAGSSGRIGVVKAKLWNPPRTMRRICLFAHLYIHSLYQYPFDRQRRDMTPSSRSSHLAVTGHLVYRGKGKKSEPIRIHVTGHRRIEAFPTEDKRQMISTTSKTNKQTSKRTEHHGWQWYLPSDLSLYNDISSVAWHDKLLMWEHPWQTHDSLSSCQQLFY